MPDDLLLTHDPAVDPVLCSPFEEPSQCWQLDRTGRAMEGVSPLDGRRESMVLSPVPDDEKSAQTQLHLSDARRNDLINRIRVKVSEWRSAGYPNVTSVTLRLLEHWADDRACTIRPFFAQREAIETLIWLREVATRQTSERRELEAETRKYNDDLVRHAVKMATGTGKTAVMGMLIAWQTLNAVRTTRRRNLQHGERFVVLTPGLTIKDRLAELKPSNVPNVYDEMGLVPKDLRDKLNRAKVEVVNFQAFYRQDLNSLGFPRSGSKGSRAHRELIPGQSDDDRKETSEQAVRRVLKSLLTGASYGDVVVINDEAHHCYLPQPNLKRSREDAKEDTRAAVWYNVLRSLRAVGALGDSNGYGQSSVVYDFSATPMWIDTSGRVEPTPFQWVASDFGLMDAIESGLTKVPRVPVDDDSRHDQTRWRNLYKSTGKKKVPKRSLDGPDSAIPAPLRTALAAQYDDYKDYLSQWQKNRPETVPAMIVVANSIDNATALYEHIAGYAVVDENGAETLYPGVFPELSNVVDGRWADTPRTLIVHSNLDKSDEITGKALTLLKEQGSRLARKKQRGKEAVDAVREVLNTVGKAGQPGAKIRCVISVGMLTEGWDARNVTHIVGYRAFSTQLLCEQVTGRALRRTSYDDYRDDGTGRLIPEYAEVVGIPFEFMPSRRHGKNVSKIDPPAITHVHSVKGRQRHRIVWPNVKEYRRVSATSRLVYDPDKVEPWRMGPLTDPSMAILSPHVGEQKIIHVGHRRNQAVFKMAAEIVAEFRNLNPNVTGDRIPLFISAKQAVSQWLEHAKVECPKPKELLIDDQQRRAAVVSILKACSDTTQTGPARIALLGSPALSDTSNLDFHTTLKCIHPTRNSELSHAACHSLLEKDTAVALDDHPDVVSWVRNFQMGWTIPYHHEGVWRRYEPDFVAQLSDGLNLIIECKGVYDEKAAATEMHVNDHWIPCVAGTRSLPDDLQRWAYVMVREASLAADQIRRINAAESTRSAPPKETDIP